MADKINIFDFVKFPLSFDDYGGEFIFDGDGNPLFQMRGWGRLQYLNEAGKRDGTVDYERAARIQDEIGKWIVEKLNEAAETAKDES